MRMDQDSHITGKEAVLRAFDRLFEKAAAKLQIQCDPESKREATRLFTERFSQILDVAAQVTVPEMPDQAMRSMEESIDELSPAQVVAYLAALPLIHQTQQMLRTIASRVAEQRYLDHLLTQSDDQYGGN